VSLRLPALLREYGGPPAFRLDCQALELDGQGFVCIIGRNGSGKSTYAEALAAKTSESDERWSYLPQHLDRFLFAETVRDQLGSLLGQELNEEKLIALMMEMGFESAEHMLDFPFILMSGGERRRMALVCAFYVSPKNLVLDEPEIGVTAKENMVLLSKLDNLRAQHAKIIVISHSHTLIRRSSDLICLSEGRIEHAGRTGELLADSSFDLKRYGVRFS